jgi:hypothetical protein
MAEPEGLTPIEAADRLVSAIRDARNLVLAALQDRPDQLSYDDYRVLLRVVCLATDAAEAIENKINSIDRDA